MKKIRFNLALILMGLVILNSGCDVFGEQGTQVHGVVSDAVSGNPISGIYVSLKIGGTPTFSSPVSEAVTAQDGSYELKDGQDRSASLVINVNMGSQNGDENIPISNVNYTATSMSVVKGKRSQLNFSLDRTIDNRPNK